MNDSEPDTIDHIAKVQKRMDEIIGRLHTRKATHDASKLREPEKSAYDALAEYKSTHEMIYGSSEYAEGLKILGPALAHHYAHNSHHPEHFVAGINGMSLLDLIEWVADCKAASERGGGVLRLDFDRFRIDMQLAAILLNTVKELGW